MGVKFIGSGGQSSIFEELFSFFWGTLLEKDTAASPGCSSYTIVLLTKIAPGCTGVYELVVGKRAKKEYPELQAKNGEKKRPLTTSRARSGGEKPGIWWARNGGRYMRFLTPRSLTRDKKSAPGQHQPSPRPLLLLSRVLLLASLPVSP